MNTKEGICVVFVPHATAGLLMNENEPGVKEDLLNSLSYMVPNNKGYKHDQVDNNATSHIKAALVGPSLPLTIHEGNLVLGRWQKRQALLSMLKSLWLLTWQQIFLCEFDGPRTARRVILQVVGK